MNVPNAFLSSPPRCVAEVTIQYRGQRASALAKRYNDYNVMGNEDWEAQQCRNDLIALGFAKGLFEVVGVTTIDFSPRNGQMKIIWTELLRNSRQYHLLRSSIRSAMDEVREGERDIRNIVHLHYHEDYLFLDVHSLPRHVPNVVPRPALAVSTSTPTQTNSPINSPLANTNRTAYSAVAQANSPVASTSRVPPAPHPGILPSGQQAGVARTTAGPSQPSSGGVTVDSQRTTDPRKRTATSGVICGTQDDTDAPKANTNAVAAPNNAWELLARRRPWIRTTNFVQSSSEPSGSSHPTAAAARKESPLDITNAAGAPTLSTKAPEIRGNSAVACSTTPSTSAISTANKQQPAASSALPDTGAVASSTLQPLHSPVAPSAQPSSSSTIPSMSASSSTSFSSSAPEKTPVTASASIATVAKVHPSPLLSKVSAMPTPLKHQSLKAEETHASKLTKHIPELPPLKISLWDTSSKASWSMKTPISASSGGGTPAEDKSGNTKSRSITTSSSANQSSSSVFRQATSSNAKASMSQVASSKPRTPTSAHAPSPKTTTPLLGSNNTNVSRTSSATAELKRKRETDGASTRLAGTTQNVPVPPSSTNEQPAAKRARASSNASVKSNSSSTSTTAAPTAAARAQAKTESQTNSSLRALLAAEAADRTAAQQDLALLRLEYDALQKRHTSLQESAEEQKFKIAERAREQLTNLQSTLQAERDEHTRTKRARADDQAALMKMRGAMDTMTVDKQRLEVARSASAAQHMRDTAKVTTLEEQLVLLRAENAQLLQTLKKECEGYSASRHKDQELTRQLQEQLAEKTKVAEELEEKLEYEREAKEIYRKDAADVRLENQRLTEAHREEIWDTIQEKQEAVAALEREGERSLRLERNFADYRREAGQVLVVPALLEAFDSIANLSTDAMRQAES
ncbi:hypothetical protein EIP91_011492 [Steccherinum ochraceum]|uniref:Uncharacterized protein n=1 Tax=Steccherinum ochraceum TaxID=92696 RepID=A0A4V2MWZ5_9APHY|nr:hypothetical protein EIP91_011492 [Steccherinum ochraceum]